MQRNCCHISFAFILKFLNFVQAFIGVSIILYSIWMLDQWNHRMPIPPPDPPSAPTPDASFSPSRVLSHDHHLLATAGSLDVMISGFDDVSGFGFDLNSIQLPAPWFIYSFMGVGILVCCITLIGCIAAEAISGCCLCFYALLKTVLIVLEAALVAFIAIDRRWEKDLPFDPTGELDSFRSFIEDNVDICKWVGITVVIIQALSLLLALILRAMVSTRRTNFDEEDNYEDERGRIREPLLNQQPSKTSGSTHSDIWSSRIREKYGLNSGERYPPSNDAVDWFLKSRGRHGLFSQIELSFSAADLRDRDVFSKSDPMLVVYAIARDGAVVEVGRTEVVLNSLNPKWIMKHTVTYQFEVVQTLLFRVYDVDTQFHNVDVKMLKLDEQQFLGEATCKLSEIVTKTNRSLTIDLVHREESNPSNPPKHHGKLIVHAEECINSKTTTELILRCSDLEYKDLFSRNDPFLVISKIVESGMPIPVCKTEVLKNEIKPTWKSVFLNIQQVGSKDSPLIIECFNFNSNGKHDLIGKVQKSLAGLEKLHSSRQGENLVLPTAAGNNHQKTLNSQLFVDKFSESVQHTFLDYLAGGFELNFMVAIDFTASNGNPRLPDSLHYLDPSGRLNAYQRAISEVGEVLQFYDTDKRFPAWGFGARPIDGPVSHCFNLNGSNSYCEVEGIPGIMMAYTSALHNVNLAGPTLFGPVISNAALIAGQSLANRGQKYFVLLIITDGVVTDLQETKDAIVKASDLPLSILIVGVGGADFKEMEILDADKGERLESSTERVASRDIVQFVPLRDVQSGELSVVQALLAELPSQFLTYMRTREIQPST